MNWNLVQGSWRRSKDKTQEAPGVVEDQADEQIRRIRKQYKDRYPLTCPEPTRVGLALVDHAESIVMN